MASNVSAMMVHWQWLRVSSRAREKRHIWQTTMSATAKRSRSLAPGSPHRVKKRKLLDSYASESPFPEFPHPTPSEAFAVLNILSKAYPTTPTTAGTGNNSAATCGNVPNVTDSLIGTILSQNTSGKNSSNSKASLDATFGRENFAAIASSSREAVVEAIRHGGLANKKAAIIQNLLKSIEERHGEYSLQHLAKTGGGWSQVIR